MGAANPLQGAVRFAIRLDALDSDNRFLIRQNGRDRSASLPPEAEIDGAGKTANHTLTLSNAHAVCTLVILDGGRLGRLHGN